jgi:hypothetical protein
MESEAVSQPLDDAGLLSGRADDPAGARTVSDCGDAIVIPSRSVGRPQVEQNRAPSERFAPQVGQATAGFYSAAPHLAERRPQTATGKQTTDKQTTDKHRRTQQNPDQNSRTQQNTAEHSRTQQNTEPYGPGPRRSLPFLCLSVFFCGPSLCLPVFFCGPFLCLPVFSCGPFLCSSVFSCGSVSVAQMSNS